MNKYFEVASRVRLANTDTHGVILDLTPKPYRLQATVLIDFEVMPVMLWLDELRLDGADYSFMNSKND